MKNKETILYTRESLQREQRKLRIAIKEQEVVLRQRVQKLPGELLYAGVDSLLPPALTGKITDKILGAGRNFVNKAVAQKANGNTSRLVTAAKQAGIFAGLKFAWKIFMKR